MQNALALASASSHCFQFSPRVLLDSRASFVTASVARLPIDLVGRLEIFFDQLLALRQPIATTHTRSPWNDWSCAAACCTICSPSWARLLFCLCSTISVPIHQSSSMPKEATGHESFRS